MAILRHGPNFNHGRLEISFRHNSREYLKSRFARGPQKYFCEEIATSTKPAIALPLPDFASCLILVPSA